MEKLISIMRDLRDPKTGCPWDVSQTFSSIAPYTIEEAYEVAEAIDSADMDALKGELGDLLFQVVFYSQIAAEQGEFEFEDVVTSISEKLVRRHPHVFAGAAAGDSESLRRDWESYKLTEQSLVDGRSDVSILAGVPKALPALTRASKLGKRAASQGFDWQDSQGVLEKIAEEAREVTNARSRLDKAELQEEFGDLLLAMTSLGRHLNIDPEESLRLANNKFESRIRCMEALMKQAGCKWSDQDSEMLEVFWELAKSREQENR